MPHLASIALHLPFLDCLARRWLEAGGEDPGSGMIILPTRRAARALTESFLRLGGGKVMLLPRIVAVGAIDEAPLALAGSLELMPAIEPMHRLAALSQLIMAASKTGEARFAGASSADQAWLLARSLADLMDEAEYSHVDLAVVLPKLATEFAEHWQVTLDFLAIVTRAWPAWLIEHQRMNPAARQADLLRAQAKHWQDRPPATRVWAAGFSGAAPALVTLLSVVARLPNGVVVLPGFDRTLAEETFASLPRTHAQSRAASLLAGLEVGRDRVEEWDFEISADCSGAVPEGRVRALHTALLPDSDLHRWLDDRGSKDLGPEDLGPEDLGQVSLLKPADQQEEAVAIALVLRDALETPGRRAALITPDRGLAARVVAELARFGVVADDSAGEMLSECPSAVLLRLLAMACEEQLAPVALLGLLKHPFAALGRPAVACRRLARSLELACLRGVAPVPGIEGLRLALARKERAPALLDFVDDLLVALGALPALYASQAPVSVPVVLEALIRAAEAFAATDARAGAEILWSQEDGNALAAHLTDLMQASETLPPQPPRVLRGLLEASLTGIAVRSRRALRGRPGIAEHPRLFIWGTLEARLQSVDLAVLGGLVEEVWPPASDPGPWMSRPMRLQAGLPSAEDAIGQAAHDFLAACCIAPEIVLSSPRRRDEAPAVPARWLVRLEAWLRGAAHPLPEHRAAGWLPLLDQPAGGPRPVKPPRPCPAMTLRPRKLNITEIEKWLRDPYAIYARHVLELVKMRPLQEDADSNDFGNVVHEALKLAVREMAELWPADPKALMRRHVLAALDRKQVRTAQAAWWRPRLLRIADDVAEVETSQRQNDPPSHIATEIDGKVVITDLDGGDFTLSGRADRIERRRDGSLTLLDYKTGTVPAKGEFITGWSPQLLLEAAIAECGGFGAELQGLAAALLYWRLTGGHEEGKQLAYEPDKQKLQALIADAWETVRGLVCAYDDPTQPYLSHPNPGRAPRYADYKLLSRVPEWSAARDQVEE